MRNLCLPLVAAVLMLTGCGVTASIHPLYSEKQAAALPIEGNWAGEKDDELFRVRKADKGYRVAFLERDEVREYDVRLVQLGETWFADIAPRDEPDLTLRLHLIAKIWFEGADLRLACLGSEWLQQAFREAGLPMVETPDRDHLLAAPTAELQKFVRGIAGEPRAFDDEILRLRRVQ